jgi:hypothetical protein
MKQASLSLDPPVPFAESRVQSLPSPESNMAPKSAIKDAGCPSAQVSFGGGQEKHLKTAQANKSVSVMGVTFRWRMGDIWNSKIAANRLWLGLREGALTKN